MKKKCEKTGKMNLGSGRHDAVDAIRADPFDFYTRGLPNGNFGVRIEHAKVETRYLNEPISVTRTPCWSYPLN